MTNLSAPQFNLAQQNATTVRNVNSSQSDVLIGYFINVPSQITDILVTSQQNCTIGNSTPAPGGTQSPQISPQSAGYYRAFVFASSETSNTTRGHVIHGYSITSMSFPQGQRSVSSTGTLQVDMSITPSTEQAQLGMTVALNSGGLSSTNQANLQVTSGTATVQFANSQISNVSLGTYTLYGQAGPLSGYTNPNYSSQSITVQVTQPPLDTSITLGTSAYMLDSSETSYNQTLSGGSTPDDSFETTIYWIFDVGSISDGSDIVTHYNAGTNYVARTWDEPASGSRTFRTVNTANTYVTANLPSTGSTKTYYVYASDSNGKNSVKLTNTYTVGKVQNRTINPFDYINDSSVSGFYLDANESGGTSGATFQYKWSMDTSGTSGKYSKTAWDFSGWKAETAWGGSLFGVGVEWQGTIWTVRTRASLDGVNWAYGPVASVTLPWYIIGTTDADFQTDGSGNKFMDEGDTVTFNVSSTTNGLFPVYYQEEPSSDFSGTTTGSLSSSSSTFNTTAATDSDINDETVSVKLYIASSAANRNQYSLVDTLQFYIKDAGVPADLTPDNPSFTNIQQAATSSAFTENWQTTGLDSGNQVTWTATASAGTVQLSTDNSTYVSGATGIQRSLNQTGYVKLTTTSSQNTTHTVTVSTSSGNGASGSWTVTTASSGQQGQQTVGGTAFQYGLEIYNSQGQKIIDSLSRPGNIIATAQFSISGSQASSGVVKFQGFDCSQTTKTGIIIDVGTQFSQSPHYERRSQAQQGIILYPNQSTSQTVTGTLYLVTY